MKKNITNIVICYANEDEVVTYARQLAIQTISNKIHLTIVINKEAKGEQYLQEKMSEIGIRYSIYNPGRNLGYLNGLLFGYSKMTTNSEWYVLSNTDIEIFDNQFFETFANGFYLNDKDIWLVGPSVYAQLRKLYTNPYLLNRPTKTKYIVKNIGMTFPSIYDFLFRIKSKIRAKQDVTVQPPSGMIYAIHGSFMFLHMNLMEELIKRAPWELLYDEEQYIAEVVRANNKKVFYDSSIQVIHNEGACTGKANIRNRYSCMRRSNKRLIREFY